MNTQDILVLTLQALVILYFVALNGTYTVFILLSLKEIRNYFYFVTKHDMRALLSGNYYRPLSIIVPAYNEETTITTNVGALLSLKYPEYEVIVVNDGSTDDSLRRLVEKFRLVAIKKPIRLVLKHKIIRKSSPTYINPVSFEILLSSEVIDPFLCLFAIPLYLNFSTAGFKIQHRSSGRRWTCKIRYSIPTIWNSISIPVYPIIIYFRCPSRINGKIRKVQVLLIN